MQKTEYGEIKFELGGMLFTWDDNKEKINIRKHGIDFETAAGVLLDEDAVVEPNSIDERTGEERFHTIGLTYGYLMFVVYVERITLDNQDIVRIISARFATNREEEKYDYGIRRFSR